MKKRYIGIASVIAIIGLLFVFGATPTESPLKAVSGVGYEAVVCATVTRENGEVEKLGCSGNVLTWAGMNATKTYLGAGGTVAPFDYIALRNVPGIANATETNLTDEIEDAGLTRAQGTYYSSNMEGDLENNGNWSITHEFTASATETIYGAGLFNHSSLNDTMLAIANFSTQAALENGDKLNVTWEIKVS